MKNHKHSNPAADAHIDEVRHFFKQYKIEIIDTKLYMKALTHNSYANENDLRYTYQRLEFLGDAVLSQQISLYLFLKYPEKNEGQITNLRSKMVREPTLAQVTRKIGLSHLILLGKGEIKSNGADKDSILSDVYESILGALYLDLGEEIARSFIYYTLIKFIDETNFIDQIQDYKTQLQELLQAGDKRALEYALDRETKMEANKIRYEVSAKLDNMVYGRGVGFSLKEAEQQAAKDCLSKLAKND